MTLAYKPDLSHCIQSVSIYAAAALAESHDLAGQYKGKATMFT
ncbi:hypothetical protein [Asaia bogorensis]|nr:hypothetical protein [Asaia bogorensis]MDR6182077.1 hypothetical protein [Asaia bogorensis NBRC 16594]